MPLPKLARRPARSRPRLHVVPGEAREPVFRADPVPLRRIMGAPETPGRWYRTALRVAPWGGWLLAVVVIAGGGLLLGRQLFGDRVGGDVWLGRPPAAAVTQPPGVSTTSPTNDAPAATDAAGTREPGRAGDGGTHDLTGVQDGGGHGDRDGSATTDPEISGSDSSGHGSDSSGAGSDSGSGSDSGAGSDSGSGSSDSGSGSD